MDKFVPITSDQVADLSLDTFYDSDQPPSLDLLMRILAQPAGRAWAILGAHGIQGIVWFSIVQDEAEIIDIRVSEAYRRQGVGESLLTHYGNEQLSNSRSNMNR